VSCNNYSKELISAINGAPSILTPCGNRIYFKKEPQNQMNLVTIGDTHIEEPGEILCNIDYYLYKLVTTYFVYHLCIYMYPPS